MAVPRQVNAGRRTKFLVRNRTWTYGRPRNALIDKETGKVAKSGERQESQEMGKAF
ncbi:MAG: hypothetical protein WB053_07395 [Nitrososphaeraceae archaeon]|jgi:hypothetical protein